MKPKFSMESTSELHYFILVEISNSVPVEIYELPMAHHWYEAIHKKMIEYNATGVDKIFSYDREYFFELLEDVMSENNIKKHETEVPRIMTDTFIMRTQDNDQDEVVIIRTDPTTGKVDSLDLGQTLVVFDWKLHGRKASDNV